MEDFKTIQVSYDKVYGTGKWYPKNSLAKLILFTYNLGHKDKLVPRKTIPEFILKEYQDKGYVIEKIATMPEGITI